MTHRAGPRLFLATLMVMAIAACSATGENPEQDSTVSTTVLDCDNPIQVLDGPPKDWLLVADLVALPLDQPLQRGRFDGELGRSFSKFGLVMRPDRAFTIDVVPESRPNALIEWGTNSSEASSSIEVRSCPGICEPNQPACPLGERADWVVYPGGVWTINAECISIEIATDQLSEIVRLPIGTECS